MVTGAYIGFLALLALERLWEVRIARRNARQLLAQGAVEIGRGHFPVMVLMHTLFPFACAAEVILLRRPFYWALAIPTLVGALAAQGLRYWAIATLGPRWNVRVLVLPERPPVVGGPYRYVRHPNYVAVIAEMALVPLIHCAWWTALLFSAANAAVLTVRIRCEEKALGPGYAQAFAAQPRFVPRGVNGS